MLLSPDGGEGGGETLLSGQQGEGATPSVQNPPVSETPKGYMGEDGAFIAGWTDRLPEELGDARKGLGKFKTFGEMARSHVNLEQKLGSKATMIAMPGPDAKPEEVAAFRTAMGVPEKIEDYKVIPDNLPEGVTVDEAQLKPFVEAAHKLGIPPDAMKQLVALEAQREAQREAAVKTVAKEELQKGFAMLRSEWGDQYDTNIGLAGKAAAVAGLDLESPGLTDPLVVKALAKIASLLDDDKFVGVGGRNGLGTTEDAKDIMTNSSNPLHAKYREGDPDTVEKVRALLKKNSARR